MDGQSCCDECIHVVTLYVHICRNGSFQLQCITSVYLFGYRAPIIVKIPTYQTQDLGVLCGGNNKIMWW